VDERAEASPVWSFAVSTLQRSTMNRIRARSPALAAVFSVAEASAAVARANDVTVRMDIDEQEAWARRALRAPFQAE
jgi:hypothetical protein